MVEGRRIIFNPLLHNRIVDQSNHKNADGSDSKIGTNISEDDGSLGFCKISRHTAIFVGVDGANRGICLE